MLIYDKEGPYTIFERVSVAVILLTLGYETLNVFISNAEMLKYWRILGVASYAVSLYIFAPDCWVGMFKRPPRPRDYVICAIWLKFFGDWLFALHSLVFRLAGEPRWMLNNELLPGILNVGMIAVYLHISSPGQNGEGVPQRNRYAMAYGIGASILLIGLVATGYPSIAPIVNSACPYLSDWFGTDLVNRCRVSLGMISGHG